MRSLLSSFSFGYTLACISSFAAQSGIDIATTSASLWGGPTTESAFYLSKDAFLDVNKQFAISYLFDLSSPNITFFGNNHSLEIFQVNTPQSPGSAITSSGKEICFTGFKSFILKGCTGIASPLAMPSGSVTFINNQNVVLQNNISPNTSFQGGAIRSESINIINNENVTISYNVSSHRGGALGCKNVSLSNNSGYVTLSANRALNNGGAIQADESADITNNAQLVTIAFNRSLTNSNGGAIYAKNLLIENNLQGVVFEGNTAGGYGGAIYGSSSIILRNNGPVSFINNFSSNRGGISPAINGSLILSADYGDIFFDNNRAASSPTNVFRSALQNARNSSISIGARQNYAVRFYDPIGDVLSSTNPLLLNPDTSNQGTIQFSGAHVLTPTIADLYSYLKNTTIFANGTLAIEDGAVIAAYQFNQTGGTVKLGNAAIITTSPNAVADTGTPVSETSQINLTNLALNFPSIATTGATAPLLWIYPSTGTGTGTTTYTENTAAKISLTGNLSLLDEDNLSPYEESPLLAKPISNLTLLKLSEGATSGIDITNFDASSLNQQPHYGYQGSWTTTWQETTVTPDNTRPDSTNTKQKTLLGSWTPNSYRVHPESLGSLVPNVSWQMAFETRSLLACMDSLFGREDPEDNLKLDLHVSGLFIHQNSIEDSQGYHSKSLRYTIGEALHSFEGLAMTFSQTFSHMREKVTDNKVVSHGYFAGVHMLLPRIHQFLHTKVSLAYGYFSHSMHSQYASLLGSSNAKFHGTSCGGNLTFYFTKHSDVRFSKNLHFYLSPYAQIQGLLSQQGSFTENGDHKRKFSSLQDLWNISIPLGIEAQASSNFYFPSSLEFQIAYLPAVYRKAPTMLGTMVSNLGTWNALGASVTRHSITLQGKSITYIHESLQALIEYRAEISSSMTHQNIQLGSKLIF